MNVKARPWALLALVLLVVASLGTLAAAKDGKGRSLPGELRDKIQLHLLHFVALHDGGPDDSPVHVQVPDIQTDAHGKVTPTTRKTGLGPCGTYPASLLDALLFATFESAGVKPVFAAGMNPEDLAQMTPYGRFEVTVNREAGIEKLLGAKLVARVEKTAGPGRRPWRHYDPAILEAAWATLYVKPEGRIAGYAAKLVYDTVYKESLAKLAARLAAMAQVKGFIEDNAKAYEKAAKTDPAFDVHGFLAKLSERFGEGSDVESFFIGTVLRRQIDGTLPVLRGALKATLKDYDPDAFKKYGGVL